MTSLSADHVHDLRDLAAIYDSTPISLIGASALALQMEPQWRRTLDLDLTIALSIGEYPGAISGSKHWTPEPGNPIRWSSERGTRIDLIPAGPEDIRRGSVVWPGGTREMSLIGFRHAFERGIPIKEVDRPNVTVAPVPIVALLKIVSYQDRPTERERDLQDLAYILDRYPAADDDRRFSDLVYENDMTSETAGAFVLGTELGAWIDARERNKIDSLFDLLLEEVDGGRTRAVMLRNAPSAWGRDTEELLNRVLGFKQGLEVS